MVLFWHLTWASYRTIEILNWNRLMSICQVLIFVICVKYSVMKVLVWYFCFYSIKNLVFHEISSFIYIHHDSFFFFHYYSCILSTNHSFIPLNRHFLSFSFLFLSILTSFSPFQTSFFFFFYSFIFLVIPPLLKLCTSLILLFPLEILSMMHIT